MSNGVTKTGNSPLYEQLSAEILGKISAGEYPEGERIPSEAELSDAHSVSRITVRRAIENLCAEGYLFKKQGLGTFVSKPKMSRALVHGGLAKSFTEVCTDSGRVPGFKLVKREIVLARPEEQRFFELSGDALLLHICRIRTADNQPVFQENIYVPYEQNKLLMTEDFVDGSIFTSMERFYGRKPRKNRSVTVEAVSASAVIASQLQISKGDALLLVTTHADDADDKPIYIGRQYYVGNRYVMSL